MSVGPPRAECPLADRARGRSGTRVPSRPTTSSVRGSLEDAVLTLSGTGRRGIRPEPRGSPTASSEKGGHLASRGRSWDGPRHYGNAGHPPPLVRVPTRHHRMEASFRLWAESVSAHGLPSSGTSCPRSRPGWRLLMPPPFSRRLGASRGQRRGDAVAWHGRLFPNSIVAFPPYRAGEQDGPAHPSLASRPLRAPPPGPTSAVSHRKCLGGMLRTPQVLSY